MQGHWGEPEYHLIRIKQINYQENPALAIYFQNMTKHVTQLRLESEILEQKNKNISLQTYTTTISHEFRTPLSATLMFLQNILEVKGLSPEVIKTVYMVISQMNLLLSLVNDVLDMKQIEVGEFTSKIQLFNPV